MSQIIDWEYYSSHFPNAIPEKIFSAVEVQAEAEYNKVVCPYMKISEEKHKNTIFQLCNFLYTSEQIGAGKGVSSSNNAGVSMGYTIQTREQMADEIRELIYECIGTRLAGAF